MELADGAILGIGRFLHGSPKKKMALQEGRQIFSGNDVYIHACMSNLLVLFCLFVFFSDITTTLCIYIYIYMWLKKYEYNWIDGSWKSYFSHQPFSGCSSYYPGSRPQDVHLPRVARCGLRGWVTLGKTLMAISLQYCRWFRNPEPVEVGSLSYYLQGFIQRSWSTGAGFLPSTVTVPTSSFQVEFACSNRRSIFFGHIVPLTSFGAKLIGYFSEHHLMSFVLNPPKNCIRNGSTTSFSPYTFQGWLKSRRSKWLEVGKCRFAVSVWYVLCFGSCKRWPCFFLFFGWDIEGIAEFLSMKYLRFFSPWNIGSFFFWLHHTLKRCGVGSPESFQEFGGCCMSKFSKGSSWAI